MNCNEIIVSSSNTILFNTHNKKMVFFFVIQFKYSAAVMGILLKFEEKNSTNTNFCKLHYIGLWNVSHKSRNFKQYLELILVGIDREI